MKKIENSDTGYKSKYYAAAQQMQRDIERNIQAVEKIKKLLKNERIAVSDNVSPEFKKIVHIRRYNDRNVEIDAIYYVQKRILNVIDKVICNPDFEKVNSDDRKLFIDALFEDGYDYNETNHKIIKLITVKVGDICEVIRSDNHYIGIVKTTDGSDITISILDGENLKDMAFSTKDSKIKKVSLEEKQMFKDWLSLSGFEYNVIKKKYLWK